MCILCPKVPVLHRVPPVNLKHVSLNLILLMSLYAKLLNLNIFFFLFSTAESVRRPITNHLKWDSFNSTGKISDG